MMSQEIIYAQIKDRIFKMGFNSVNFRLSLIKEENRWKIFLARVIFEIEKPRGRILHHKQDDFIIEDFSISIEDFNKFLDYLKRVDIGNITFEDGKAIIPDESLYSIGDHKLCFAGNMTNGNIMFLRRSHGLIHGIDHPLYMIQYFIHSSILATSYQRIIVISQEIPLADVIDAINHFWGTNYESYSISHDFPIYMPVYDGSIASCNFGKNGMIVKIDTDNKKIDQKELSVSIVVDKKLGDYRKKLVLNSTSVVFDISFDPQYARIFLHKDNEMLDEYYYTSALQTVRENQIFHQEGMTVVPSESLLSSHVGTVNENTRKINPVFKGRNFTIESDLCFVLMPFRVPFTTIFEKHIKPTLTKSGFRVMKADDIFKSTPIVEDVWEHINKARLIIADVTDKNPNVFYELGISHTVGTEIFILTQNEKDIPFDLTHYRYFLYENT